MKNLGIHLLALCTEACPAVVLQESRGTGERRGQGPGPDLLSATQPISSTERRFTRETSADIPGLGRILILCSGLQCQPGRLQLSRPHSASPASSAPAEGKERALREGNEDNG